MPLIIRPAFTLGGSGGGIAYNMAEFENIVKGGLDASATSQVLIEQVFARLEGVRARGDA